MEPQADELTNWRNPMLEYVLNITHALRGDVSGDICGRKQGHKQNSAVYSRHAKSEIFEIPADSTKGQLNPPTAFVKEGIELDFVPTTMVINPDTDGKQNVTPTAPTCPADTVVDCFKKTEDFTHVIVTAKADSAPKVIKLIEASDTNSLQVKFKPIKATTDSPGSTTSTAAWMSGSSVVIVANLAILTFLR
ncbi:unnamed protein product [Dibothriocephalus latus]|uniref:Uncharacterized protein n=1 Tax=Dibothriocephalus latus TaxID=60516 RepID=A0A3P6S9X9_DIBLA|nr:unnamed protein product [Dibothriocephalus latus]